MTKTFALLMAIMVLLAACGANADEPAAGAAGTSAPAGEQLPEVETDSEPAAEPVDDAADGSETGAEGTPQTLDEYLGTAARLVRGGGGGAGGGAGGFDEDEVVEQQRLVQQEIQKCMLTQGFEYLPEEVGDGLRFFLATAQSVLSPLDYAQTEGFGISTGFDAIFEGELDLTEATSPNDDHVATLSEGEADAWQIALRGEAPARNDQGELIDPETGEVIAGGGRRGPTSGCSFEAQETVRGDFDQLAALANEFDELEERIAADPRIAEIALSWQDCMRTEGYDFADETEARQAINQDFRPLLRSFFQSQNADGQGAQVGGGGQGGGNQLARVAGLELTAEQEVELEALQETERAMAVSSVTCEGETSTEVDEITARYESEFVETNRAALEAFGS